MRRSRLLLAPVLLLPPLIAVGGAVRSPSRDEVSRHEQEVMRSRYCARCHPVIYAEHAQNTHGRAFTDTEARLATGSFRHGDCIICHTPRPIFETGIGMNPMRRHFDLEEGITCMTCHWKAGQDYGHFEGGAECKTAFDARAGQVEACASCHRNHGTPYQWALAPTGKKKGRKCMNCHMARVRRPVAVGEPPRRVHSHVFPGSRSEHQLRRAYRYKVAIRGNEVVVTIRNKGAGHNFPTELKQRALESLVVVRDREGKEVARSRMVFRDPYKRPYGLKLPVNTQIPAGQSVEHRVPIGVAEGSVDCELHFKLYFPIEDHYPGLARLLERRRIPFQGITPSTRPVVSTPEVRVRVPDAIAPEVAGAANLVDFAKPAIGKVAVEIPEGSEPADIARLIGLFQFPVPQANVEARHRLVAIGEPAVPALLEALGSWDNKTWKQAMAVLERIGSGVTPRLVAALGDPRLYVRVHARELLVRLGAREPGARQAPGLENLLREGLRMANALDRRSAAKALLGLGFEGSAPALRKALGDRDPDVVAAAAKALAGFGDAQAVPSIRAALSRFIWVETRAELATALARLGQADAVQLLIAGLDQKDELIRKDFFERLFAVTGLHFAYDPKAPRPERLEAIADLERSWGRTGGPQALRAQGSVSREVREETWQLVKSLGGGDGLTPGGDDARIMGRLVGLGADAVPAIVLGLEFPPGFARKRADLCNVAGQIGDKDAVPALVAALRDPVAAVAAWACWALARIGDAAALPALERYDSRLRSLAAAGRIPKSAGHPDQLLAQSAGARLACGERRARTDLVVLLLSADRGARLTAIGALKDRFGEDRGFDADASVEQRRRAAARWAK